MIGLDEFELRRDRENDVPLIVRGEAYLPAGAAGTVVICHGFKGFAHFAFFPYLASALASAGIRAVTFDFSGSGIGEDRENFTNRDAFTHNTYRQELDDLETVIAESEVRGWITDGFGLLGHSRGGGVAILHASRNPDVKALVTWASISNANRWTPEIVREWKERGYMDIANARTGEIIPLSTELLHEVEELGEGPLNISAAAALVPAPWLIVHGDADESVSVGEAEQLYHLSGGVSTLRLVEGGNHVFGAKHPLTETPESLRTVTTETVAFFAEQLPKHGR